MPIGYVIDMFVCDVVAAPYMIYGNNDAFESEPDGDGAAVM